MPGTQRSGLWKTVGELSLQPSFPMPLLGSGAKSLGYDSSVFGTIKVTRSILPYFRRRRAGIIIMMSSSGGIAGMPGASPYASSKFALEGTREFLR